MKRIVQLILLLLVVAGVVLGWRHFHPGPEAQIRKRMDRLQSLVAFSGSEGNLAMLANLQELGSLFTEDAQIRVDVPGGIRGTLRGRESIIQAAGGARQVAGSLKVEFLDVTVTLGADGRSAVMEATAKAVPKPANELWVQELRLQWIKTDEGWRISSVETVRTLTGTEFWISPVRRVGRSA